MILKNAKITMKEGFEFKILGEGNIVEDCEFIKEEDKDDN